MQYDELITHFNVKSRKRDSCQCICPCHKDKEPSLTISKGKNQNIVMYCHAGCSTEDILASVGLSISDISNESNKPSYLDRIAYYYGTKKGYGDGVKVTAEYPYRNEHGEYLYSKVRIEGGTIDKKIIRYYEIDRVNDEYKPCKKENTTRTLYRLPELIKYRKKAKCVYITEGEKDVHTLINLDSSFVATTTAGSASDWQSEYAKYFKGCDVVLFRDNDKAGIDSVKKIVKDLRRYAHRIRIVCPSDKEHGDVTDYLTKEGGTLKSLIEMCNNPEEQYFGYWVELCDKGIKVNAGLLAEQVAQNEHYIITRNPSDDKEQLYFYEAGVYRPMNKSGVKGIIKEYIPTAKQSDHLLNNVYSLLMSSNENIYNVNMLNADESIINFKNGLYSVKDRKLIPHTPKILSSFQYGFDYNPDVTNCPIFTKYINELCTKPDGTIDKKEIDIIQEYLGFIISNVKMQSVKSAMVLWSRLGNTGKSVLNRLITYICGYDRVASIKLNELTIKNNFILGTLPYCRVISCGDESNSNVTDSSIFKALTGGDPVKVEPKGKQGYTYIYNGGFVIACNGLPCFEDDKGLHLFDRLIILPCEHHITDDIKDANLSKKLEKEVQAVVNWAIVGLHRLIDNRYIFTKSDSSELSKEEYRKTMDSLYRFVSENYVITNKREDRIYKTTFDDAYARWCTDNNCIAVSKKNITGRMDSIGITHDRGNVKDHRNIEVYRGIRAKESVFTKASDTEIPY